MSAAPKIYTIPNAITCLNLLSGCIAIVLALDGKYNLVFSAYFIILAAVFNFLDGFAARLLKSYSDVGKELDSLADVVSFGIAPSFIMFNLMRQTMRIKELGLGVPKLQMLILFTAFLIAIFSALRLAKFNVDERQKHKFIGLPTPANALFIASLPLIIEYDPAALILFPQMGNNIYFFLALIIVATSILKLYILLPVVIISSFLLIAEFPMFSLKFENYSFAENRTRYLFIGISILLFIIFQSLAVPFIVFLYILISFVHFIISIRSHRIAKKNVERILAR